MGQASRSSGKELPAKRAEPRGITFTLRLHSVSARVSFKHFEVCETPMCEKYRLRLLQMCVARNNRVNILLREIE